MTPMYTVAFVDDETLVRAGLRATIDWNGLGFEIVGDYSSAEQVLQANDQHRLDVLFVDIMMPGIDGITLLERLHETHPDTLCVVLTSFGEFSYAQRALRSGAKDYLLKSSIDAARLSDLMTHLKMELDSRNRPKASDVSGPDSMVRAVFGVTGRIPEATQLGTTPGDVVPARMFLLLPEAEDANGTVEPGTAASVASLVRPVFESAAFARVVDTGRRTIGALLKAPANEILIMLEAARRTIRLHANLDSRIVAVQPSPGENGDLEQSLERLRRECAADFYADDSGGGVRVIRVGDRLRRFTGVSPKDPMTIYEAIETRLSGLLGESSHSVLRAELETLRIAAASSGMAPDDFTEMLYALATGIYRELHSLNPGTPVVPSSSFHQDLRDSVSASSAVERLLLLFTDASHTLKDRALHDRVPAVTRARAYIARNYDRMLSLDEVADACSVNPSYLSRVFHQTTGYTFTNYVNRLRVERAKELLVTRPNAFVYEIALELGFEDSAYFSRLFRALSGTTPGSWRKAHYRGPTEEA